MQPQTDGDYKKIFTELIKKQMIVLGPDITLAKVKNVQGIEINTSGEVTNINGDAQAILQLLINQFVELSGTIVKKTMESILTTYPGVMTISSNNLTPHISTGPSQVEPVKQVQNNPLPAPVMGANPFSDGVSQNPRQSEQAPIEATAPAVGLAKEDMESINKALSELGSSSFSPAPGLENKTNDVSQ